MQEEPTGARGELKEESKEADSRDGLKESTRRIWLAGLGALAAASEEGSRMFDRLVERGATGSGIERTAEVQNVESFWQGWADELDQKVAATLGRLGLPTQDEVNLLERRIEELQTSLDGLESQMRRARAASWNPEGSVKVGSGSAGLPGTSGKPPR